MSKRKGTRNEHKAIKTLEAAGYYCTRAAGSLGIFDIVAISKGCIRLIQVKTNENCRAAEREALEQFKTLPANAYKEIWIYKDYAREPIIKEVA